MAGSGAALLPLVLQLLSLVPAQGMGTGKSGSVGSAGQDPVLAQTSLREGAGVEVASPDPCLGGSLCPPMDGGASLVGRTWEAEAWGPGEGGGFLLGPLEEFSLAAVGERLPWNL